MIWTLLQCRMPSPARCIIPVCALAVMLGGCATGPRSDDIPEVAPLSYTPPTEAPVETITTLPTAAGAPTAPAPAPTAQSPAPGAPSATSVKTTAVSNTGAGSTSSQDQRIAALELNLLNMNNELAWLKSQPASPTTPWGTPSPKVVPAKPLDVQDMTQPAPAGTNAPATKNAPAPATSDKAQADRIATLERNMQAIHEELSQLRGQQATQASPWGKTTPSLTSSGTAQTPPAQVPAAQTPTVQKNPAAVAPAVAPSVSPPPPAAQTQTSASTAPVQPNTPVAQTTAAPVPPTPAQAPVQHPAQTSKAPVSPTPVTSTPVSTPTQATAVAPAPAQMPTQTSVQTPTPAATPAAPGQPRPPINVTQASPHTDRTNIPQPSPEAVATPPLRKAGATPRAAGQRSQTAPQPVYTAPATPTAPQAQPVQTAQPAQVQPVRPTYSAPAAPATPPAQMAPAARGGEQAAYQAALNAYESRNYNEAWNGFDRYLADYPNGRFIPNALYWKGEVRYSLGDYAGAILQFKDVVGRFPQHQKAPDALLKMVMSYNRLQDKDNATLHLRILNEDYPRSEAARRAKGLGLS